MIVKCIRKCWDSNRNRQYFPGDQDEIDPLEPIASNFDFPPGTEVYFKQRGTKTTPAISTTRIVPGQVQEKNRMKIVETEESNLLKKLAAIQKEKESLTEAIQAAKPIPVLEKEPEPVKEVSPDIHQGSVDVKKKPEVQ